MERGVSAGMIFPPIFNIIENHFLTKKILIIMCRSKKRRIHKKWLKNPKNYKEVPDDKYYVFGNNITCHPMLAGMVREAIEREKV